MADILYSNIITETVTDSHGEKWFAMETKYAGYDRSEYSVLTTVAGGWRVFTTTYSKVEALGIFKFKATK